MAVPPLADNPNRKSRLPMLIGCGLFIVGAMVGLAWWQGIFNPEPEAATLEASVEALGGSTADADDRTSQSQASEPSVSSTTTSVRNNETASDEDSTSSIESGALTDGTESDGLLVDQASSIGGQLDGEWTVVPGDATFAGYRTDSPGGEVVGRSSSVSGKLTVVENRITDVEIIVDLTQLKSDSSIRDDHLGSQGIEHRTYPTAEFVLTEPITLVQLPEEGDQLEFIAKGDLTIRDTTKLVSVELDGAIVADRLLVVGSVELELEDFGAAISATSSATMEFSVVFESN